jgi:hypothetical protein
MGGGGGKIRGKVLVAAGIGSPLLVPGMPSVRGLWGASLLAKGKMKESRIHVYAPYRQAVAFQMDPEFVWMGDGTALVQKTWAKEEQTRIKSTLQRATDLFGIKGAKNGQVNIGARPYVEGHKSGYFERVHPNTWVSTGGAKSGTVLAAYFAYLFVKALK